MANIVIIGLDLLLDYNSLLFSCLRTFFLKECQTLIKSDMKQYVDMKTPSVAIKILQNKLIETDILKCEFDQTQLSKWEQLFDTHLQTIKPQIGSINTINFLSKNGFEIKLSTDLNENQIQIVKNNQKWITYDIILYQSEELFKEQISQFKNYVNKIIIDGRENILNLIQSEQMMNEKIIYIQNTLFKAENHLNLNLSNGIVQYKQLENIEWNKLNVDGKPQEYQKEYILSLNQHPSNEELKYWTNQLKLDSILTIQSKIVHGFGRGSKKLGIPTANFEMNEKNQKLLVDKVIGVYYGYTRFINSEQYQNSFKSVMSIGYNPYYDNEQKTCEVYLLNQFDHDFYDQLLEVQILGFLRTESDFKDFDHLLKFIHNDVQITRDILN